MLPPEFESIARELVALFRAFVLQDDEGTALPDLLSAEQQVAAFVRETGRTMLQVFAAVLSAPPPVLSDSLRSSSFSSGGAGRTTPDGPGLRPRPSTYALR